MRRVARRTMVWCAVGGMLAALAEASTAFAQTAPQPAANAAAGAGQATEKAKNSEQFQLPTDPTSWISSPPLTSDALEGKGAVLWFYEEQCPRCREKWPGMMATAKKFEGQPVVFIAVNSGNPRQMVQAYLQQCRITWPGIVDPSRQFEQAAGVNEISLQNIYQVRVLTPEGKLVPGRTDDLEGAARIALKGAAWKVDPATIPDSLRPAWQAIELGNYAVAGPQLKRGLTNHDPIVKEAATNLMVVVQTKIDAAIADAQAAVESGDKLSALQQYTDLPRRFQGFDLPPEVASQRKELAADPQLKLARKAAKNLADARRMLERSQAPAIRKRAETMLKQVVKDAPDTELASEAEELLGQLGGIVR